MGGCWYTAPSGQKWCETVYSPGTCDVGGEYDPNPCPDCFFTTELGSYMHEKSNGDHVVEVATLPGIMIARDFREVILRHSALGREAVELYGTHAKTAIETLRKRPRLLWRALRLTTKGIRLAQDVLRVHLFKGYPLATGIFKLDHDTALEALEVARELGKLVDTKEFDHLVSRVEWFFKQIDGMTTTQILKFLAAKAPRTHKTAAKRPRTVNRPRRQKR